MRTAQRASIPHLLALLALPFPVATPGEDLGTVSDAGAVAVIHGSEQGLAGAGNQLWHQDIEPLEETPEPSDLIGAKWVSFSGAMTASEQPLIKLERKRGNP